MRFLVDTNILSDATKPQRKINVTRWTQEHIDECCVSSVSIGELSFGIDALPDGRRKAGLQQWFTDVRIELHGRVVPFDEDAAIVWGEFRAELKANGIVLPLADSMIAATAKLHSLTVATRNERDFALAGVPTVNPFGVGS